MKTRKSITLILCAVMFFAFFVGAKSQTVIRAYSLETENKIVQIEADISDTECLVSIYDADNVLIGCEMVEIKGGLAKTKITYPDGKYSLKLYYNIGTNSYMSIDSDNVEKYIEEKQTPEEDIFTAADLDELFVVCETGKIYDEENDMIVSFVDGLYRGKEITVKFEENFPITKAFKNFSYMVGQSVEALKKGDIITLQASLSGRLMGVTFLFRAPDEDAITTEQGHLFVSDETAVFGLIADKKDNDTIILYNASGLESESEYIEIEPDTNIYIYSREGKKSKPEIAYSFDIVPSVIPGVDFDDEGNIINWTQGCIHNYAYVRLYDGEVCDIVVYENY